MMADVLEVQSTTSPIELLAAGRRHLAVRDFSTAVETLAKACELLAQEHGDTADQCAEAYLWYGKSLLGLSREESGVLGDGVPGTGNAENDDEDNDDENGEDENESDDDDEIENGKETSDDKPEKSEPESTTQEEQPKGSKNNDEAVDEPGTSNNDASDESGVNLENEDDVDNLQLAWEMLDLSRSILRKRMENSGEETARSLLADVHLALGEVALESETYDKAVIDMQSCLELQKQLYRNDDRRIAETHYQIGLANSLASNFEDAITHFKNAVNILESRIKTLEDPTTVKEDATVKRFSLADPNYSVEGEIKELKELLPEIQEKIQDMMDYKAETIKRLRESLCPSNGEASSSFSTNGAGSSSSAPKPAASDISHLIKRKRKSSETESSSSAPKRANT